MSNPTDPRSHSGGSAVTDPAASTGAPGRLAVELNDDPQGVVVTLKGELDLATVPELNRQLAGIEMAAGGRLLLDLRGVEFMDSTGLSSLIGAQRGADSNGHRLVLRRGSKQVQRLFELTTTTDRFTFES